MDMNPAMAPAVVTLPNDEEEEEELQQSDGGAEPMTTGAVAQTAVAELGDATGTATGPSASLKRKSEVQGGGLTSESKCKRCERGPSYKKGHHVSCPKSAYFGGARPAKRKARPFPAKPPRSQETTEAYVHLDACKKAENASLLLVSQVKRRLAEVQEQLMLAEAKHGVAKAATENAKSLVVEAELKAKDEWNDMFAKLKAWKEQHGDILFSRGGSDRYKTEEGYQELSQWVKAQRHKREKIKWQRKVALDSLGFCWDPFEATWRDFYGELVLFHQQHGHCNVPTNYEARPYLNTWVATQRKHYRQFQNGETSQMTVDRIQLLEDLGFSWVHAPSIGFKWHTLYDDLVVFKQLHGNFHVPKDYQASPYLHRWVATQRSQYKLRCEGKTSPMSAERIKLLDDIGFPWVGARTANPDKQAWNERFNELVIYKNVHGNCIVDPTKNVALYRFCAQQRRAYDLMQKGQPSSMTPERLDALTGIGFDLALPVADERASADA